MTNKLYFKTKSTFSHMPPLLKCSVYTRNPLHSISKHTAHVYWLSSLCLWQTSLIYPSIPGYYCQGSKWALQRKESLLASQTQHVSSPTLFGCQLLPVLLDPLHPVHSGPGTQRVLCMCFFSGYVKGWWTLVPEDSPTLKQPFSLGRCHSNIRCAHASLSIHPQGHTSEGSL